MVTSAVLSHRSAEPVNQTQTDSPSVTLTVSELRLHVRPQFTQNNQTLDMHMVIHSQRAVPSFKTNKSVQIIVSTWDSNYSLEKEKTSSFLKLHEQKATFNLKLFFPQYPYKCAKPYFFIPIFSSCDLNQQLAAAPITVPLTVNASSSALSVSFRYTGTVELLYSVSFTQQQITTAVSSRLSLFYSKDPMFISIY